MHTSGASAPTAATAQSAAYALENLLRELQATLVRDNHTAITRLVEDR
jgi:hypothetical protein